MNKTTSNDSFKTNSKVTKETDVMSSSKNEIKVKTSLSVSNSVIFNKNGQNFLAYIDFENEVSVLYIDKMEAVITPKKIMFSLEYK